MANVNIEPNWIPFFLEEANIISLVLGAKSKMNSLERERERGRIEACHYEFRLYLPFHLHLHLFASRFCFILLLTFRLLVVYRICK